MQGIFRKENTDKALKYGIYRHLPTYEKIIRNLVSFFIKKSKIYRIKFIDRTTPLIYHAQHDGAFSFSYQRVVIIGIIH